MVAAVAPLEAVSSVRGSASEDYVVDTRTPSPVGTKNGTEGADNIEDAKLAERKYCPDLSSEVAMLSTKLINAINYQTSLDDALQATRHELEQVQAQLRQEQTTKQKLDRSIADGVLVRKAEMDETISKLRAELAVERMKRESAEKQKKQTEAELENLTTSLFEEANTMVASARKDTDLAEKRNSQLKSQLQDTEFLLASQQEQLQELKLTMEKLEQSSLALRDLSVPATPTTNGTTAEAETSLDASTTLDVTPNHPLYFSYLVLPVVRTDVAAYSDFAELLALAKKATSHSRPESRNVTPSQTQINTGSGQSATTSSPSLPGAFHFSSANTSPSTNSFPIQVPALKDSKFYKRALLEDIEPTLRLDLAPGLTFLTRRSVMSSLLNGSLVVEPFVPTNYRFYAPIFACSLCGESRKQDPYIRKYRFRTSEAEDAQRYPLCDFCLGRIRATGDFLGFLRLLKDGHWRCDGEGGDKCAWEEAVRLRERMFWARLGAGVVPAASRRDMNGPLTDAHAGSERSEPTESSEVAGEDGSSSASITAIAPPKTPDEEKDEIEPVTRPQCALEPPTDGSRPSAAGSSSEENKDVETADDAVTSELAKTAETPTIDESNIEQDTIAATDQPRREEAGAAHTTGSSQPQSQPVPVKLNFSTTRADRTVSSPERFSARHSMQLRPSSSGSSVSNASTKQSRDVSPAPANTNLRSPSPLKPPSTADTRRPSAVLERVRAMEAKAGAKGSE